VAKVLAADDPSVPVEISISKQLRSVPNYRDYFILIDESCEGDDITGDPDWMECRLFAPERRRMATFVQLRMINGGTKLSDYVRNINATLKIWLDIQIHVFEGIRLLHKRHWVHGDLHMGNILVDDQGVARIVDFGLSYNLDRLKEKNLISLSFLPKFDNYPPEMDLLAGIINKTLSAMTQDQHAAIRDKWLSIRYEYGISKKDLFKWVLSIAGVASLFIGFVLFWNKRLKTLGW
jgi:serine/threonine protein kinase